MFEQRQFFDKIVESWKQDFENTDELGAEPKGESSKNDDNCDVVSIFEENLQAKSVKEKYRLEHLKRIFAQCYMQSAWNDFSFINDLKMNKVLLKSKQNEKSIDTINDRIDECVEATTKMIVSKSIERRKRDKSDFMCNVLCE